MIGGIWGDDGKENGNYFSILGLYSDIGKEWKLPYYNRVYVGVEKTMDTTI